jgi:hypothetical protein
MKNLFIPLTLIFALLTSDFFAQANTRGTKREKEECEKMALEVATNPRASGIGSSSSEALAGNIARMQARHELAAQLATQITGFLEHTIEQYVQTAGAGTTFNVDRNDYKGSVTGGENSSQTMSGTFQKDSMTIVQHVSQILNNTRPICHNIYDQPDGTIMVYVCIEMGLTEQRKLYKALKEEGVLEKDVDGDGENDIDFDEKAFLLELARAREDYNRMKAQEK